MLYLRTHRDAPNRKIITIDLTTPEPANWKTVVLEAKESLETVAIIGGRIVAEHLADVQSRVTLYDMKGARQGELELPGTGTLAGLSGREDSPTIFFMFSSPLYPSTVFAYDPTSKARTPFAAAKPPVDVSQYETKRLFATSKDGTKVPYFVTARKGIALDGNNPALLYGYGGFSVTMMPTYRSDVPAWLELGGLWVTANMRGGAEYGESWHKAGMLEKKQNVFDDFIAVAEDLIRQKYTSPAKLAIHGGSNGGLLVGAVMEQRPELFAVALPAVGVMDMLRYDKFTGGARVGDGIRLRIESVAVSVPDQVLAAAQPEGEDLLSGDARHDRRHRRPRRPEPFLQVHRGAAGGAGVRQAGAHSRREGIARIPFDRRSDRGARGPVDVHRGQHGIETAITEVLTLRQMTADDWPAVRSIYEEGVATGNATLESSTPEWESWDAGHLKTCRIVASDGTKVLGWAALTPVSGRCVYAGVAEVSVYVGEIARGAGVGRRLLAQLIEESERDGIWTLQAGILPENEASVALHQRCGFRIVGRREKLGQLNGRWRDVLLLERRSATVGVPFFLPSRHRACGRKRGRPPFPPPPRSCPCLTLHYKV